ncbi:MAG: hypothetical protein ACREOU_04380 [Candidatus Eiseniibacteriota bacterium]
MTGLVRKALTIAAGLAVVATVASAGVPDPRNSTTEAVIVGNVTGNPLGAPGDLGTSAVGGFEVIVRDINNTALIGRPVTLDFASAANVRLFNSIGGGITINCAAKTLTKPTDGTGLALFAAKIGGFANTDVVEVSADGVALANVKARSTDIDHLDGTTGLGDFGLFANNFLNVPSAPESDFNVDGTTGLGDLGIFAVEFLAAVSAAYCP